MRNKVMRSAVFLAGLLVMTSGSESLLTAAEVVTIAGTGTKGNSPDGAVAERSAIGEPYGLSLGPDGGLYVCEIANHLVRRVDLKTGSMQVIAGNGRRGLDGIGGPAREATLNEPYEVRFDSRGNLLFVDMKNAVVCRVDQKTDEIAILAGTGQAGFSGDDGPATQAMLNQPHSIALDQDDNIYICDIKNMRVRRVDATTGTIKTLAGGGNNVPTFDKAPIENLKLNGPRALVYDGKHSLVLALREGNAIYRLDLTAGTLRHLAGTGKSGFVNGPGRQAQLSGPKGVSLAPNGDIYFADTESHTVIRAKDGQVETVVGDGQRGDGPDGDPLKCRLARPHGVYVSANGTLYIGDSENHRVRMLRLERN